MRATDHGDVVAAADSVEARVLHGRAGVELAVSLLDEAEDAAGVPLVDESERARLEALADGREARADHWHSLLARCSGRPVGYAALVVPPNGGRGQATGDVAIAPHDRPETTLTVLLQSLETLARRHEAGRVQAWLRHASDGDVARATAIGYCVDRRLGVLGRRLDDVALDAPPDRVTIRPFREEDADAVVAALAAAYADTPDGDWTRQQFDERRGYDWFRPEDLLVADDDGRITGLHWTKRRGARVGEVYNLAVTPAAQGTGLGGALLTAGLLHLHRTGCTEALLWVDLSNERAVRLYVSHGFHLRWEDVAFGHHLGPR